MPFLDRHIVAYLVVFAASLTGAVILFFLGGYAATVSGVEKETGLQMQFTGSLAGFVIILLFSLHAISRLERSTGRNVRLTFFIKGKPKRFDPQDSSYKCTFTLFDANSGNTRAGEIPVGFQLEYMTVHIFDVREEDLVRIRIANAAGDVWESEEIPARQRKIDIASH
jgi:hypothetical protein